MRRWVKNHLSHDSVNFVVFYSKDTDSYCRTLAVTYDARFYTSSAPLVTDKWSLNDDNSFGNTKNLFLLGYIKQP